MGRVAPPPPKVRFDDLYRPLWMRVRFRVRHDDPRPVIWPPPGPYWWTGSGKDKDGNSVNVIVAYTKDPDKLKEFWPEMGEMSFSSAPEPVRWFDRFPKPDWIIDDL